jgi:hypothetical protein
MCQQAWPGKSTINGAMRRRFLHDAIAPDAGELGPNDADHLETGRYVFQRFGNILAQDMERASAIGTRLMFRCVRFGFARQMGR